MRKTILILLTTVFSLAAADVTGKWTGTFTPEGAPDGGPALIILEQKGDTVTGTAGPDEGQRMDIANGKVTGDKITFDVGGGAMKFELTLQGEELTGQATRERDGQKQTAKVAVKRAK